MKKNSILIFILSILCTSFCWAGGFQVNLKGQKQQGMAHTGTALVRGPSTMFFNPGGMAFMKSTSISFGISPAITQVSFLQSGSGLLHQKKNIVDPPFSFYAGFRPKEDSKWRFGVGAYTPYGATVKWEEDFAGRFAVQGVVLKVFAFQATAAYQINDKLGIGAAFYYANGSLELQQAVPLETVDGEGLATLNGSGHAFGYNVGIYYKVSKEVQIGVRYMSGSKVNIKNGESVFEVPESVRPLFPNTGFTTDVQLPGVLSFGLAYQASDKLLFAFDMNFTQWAKFQELRFTFDEEVNRDTEITSPRNYRSVLAYRIGAEYQATDKWILRGGAYYDHGPAPDCCVTPDVPDDDRWGITAGITFRPTEKLDIDASILFTQSGERTTTNGDFGISGTYKSRGIVPGIGLQYSF